MPRAVLAPAVVCAFRWGGTVYLQPAPAGVIVWGPLRTARRFGEGTFAELARLRLPADARCRFLYQWEI